MEGSVQAEQQPEFIRFQTISGGRKFVTGLDQLYRDLLQEGTDYGILPGTTKPCMFKSGAEILAKYFGLTTSSRLVQRIVEREPPYIEFQFTTDVYYMGTKVADGSGSCNSMEPKYAFRYDHGSQREATRNEIFGLLNTIMKMALKRSYIDAVLRATGASRIFTQDLEDMEPAVQNGSVSQAAAGTDGGVQHSRERPATDRQIGTLSGYREGLHAELLGLLIRKAGKRGLKELTVSEASRIMDELFSFRECSRETPESLAASIPGLRYENGVLRPGSEQPSVDDMIRIVKACWTWDGERNGYVRSELKHGRREAR